MLCVFGTGYLLVFLFIQPSALKSFKAMFGWTSESDTSSRWVSPSWIRDAALGSEHGPGASESSEKRSSLFSLADMDEEQLAQELDKASELLRAGTMSSRAEVSNISGSGSNLTAPSNAPSSIMRWSGWGQHWFRATESTRNSESTVVRERNRSMEVL